MRRLDAAGWKVFAGVRKEEDAAALREESSARLEPLLLDITDAEAIAAAAERIGAEPGGLDGLVDNAGAAVPGPLEALPIEDFRRQIELNLTAQLAVTQAMLPRSAPRAGGSSWSARSAVGWRSPSPAPTTRRSSGSRGSATASARSSPRGGSGWCSSSRARSTPRSGPAARKTPTRSLARAPRMGELYGAAIERYRKVIRDTAERGIPPEKVAAKIQHALEVRRPRAPLPDRPGRAGDGAPQAAAADPGPDGWSPAWVPEAARRGFRARPPVRSPNSLGGLY